MLGKRLLKVLDIGTSVSVILLLIVAQVKDEVPVLIRIILGLLAVLWTFRLIREYWIENS